MTDAVPSTEEGNDNNIFADVLFIIILGIIYCIGETGTVVVAKKVSTIPNMVTSSQARGTTFLII